MINYLAEKLNIRKPFLYLLIICLLICTYFILIEGEINFFVEKYAQVNFLEQEIKSLEKKIKPLDQRKLEKTQEEVEIHKEKYEIGIQSQLVLEQTNKYAQSAGLTIAGFKTHQKNNQENFKSRVYEYIFTGHYENFINWLKLMEKSSYYVNLERLHISPDEFEETDLENKNYDQRLLIVVSINNISLNEYKWVEKTNTSFRRYPFYPSIVLKEEV
ncbi:hypothetical protein SAMN00017405_0267 [Desulfonispora thiosulfatigenes DSM 11270]|uniref:Type IV pilus assembly protein PilO n=1 Tax=Desulfonispora thiosulfatigenes DSM 11270 TaxID=656914 RepID=A0A1W1VN11_DESTI|nr:hypothetical protein [Desulfonispora thiosulfatigenes]SMB94752.1 hypothetical protein SAMN00017405_0267 [Desulfonispora thiosulfatigenes DSM 11270]